MRRGSTLIGWTVVATAPVLYAVTVAALDGGSDPFQQGAPIHNCILEDGDFVTADGGCKDLATGLVWSRSNLGVIANISFDEATAAAAAATEGGFDDWRLPTVEEWLAVLANGGATHFDPSDPSGDGDVDGYPFAEGHVFLYWTSESQGHRSAWTVDINSGSTKKSHQGSGLYFGAVRASSAPPPPPPPPCNNNGVCELNENCETCPNDCDGKRNGPPSGRYCCGNGIAEGPEGDGSICDGNY